LIHEFFPSVLTSGDNATWKSTQKVNPITCQQLTQSTIPSSHNIFGLDTSVASKTARESLVYNPVYSMLRIQEIFMYEESRHQCKH
jgi:heptaprenylglyceryl phosphate synthase